MVYLISFREIYKGLTIEEGYKISKILSEKESVRTGELLKLSRLSQVKLRVILKIFLKLQTILSVNQKLISILPDRIYKLKILNKEILDI